MTDAPENTSDRSAHHVDRALGLDADGVTVQYSDSIREKLGWLHNVVKDSKHFDSSRTEALRQLSVTPEANVKALMPMLLIIGKETTRHVEATGDKRAEKYLSDLIEEMSNEKGTGKPFSLVKGRPQSRHEGLA